jgi:hypothetical protein
VVLCLPSAVSFTDSWTVEEDDFTPSGYRRRRFHWQILGDYGSIGPREYDSLGILGTFKYLTPSFI